MGLRDLSFFAGKENMTASSSVTTSSDIKACQFEPYRTVEDEEEEWEDECSDSLEEESEVEARNLSRVELDPKEWCECNEIEETRKMLEGTGVSK